MKTLYASDFRIYTLTSQAASNCSDAVNSNNCSAIHLDQWCWTGEIPWRRGQPDNRALVLFLSGWLLSSSIDLRELTYLWMRSSKVNHDAELPSCGLADADRSAVQLRSLKRQWIARFKKLNGMRWKEPFGRLAQVTMFTGAPVVWSHLVKLYWTQQYNLHNDFQYKYMLQFYKSAIKSHSM